MTLLELLVEELPGRGGWPNRGILAVQDVDKWICFSTLPEVEINGGEWGNNGGEWVSCIKNCEHLAEDYSKAIITREQYEAALAASKEMIINKPDSDGWISWCGGECPVDGDVVVDVKFRAQGQADLDGDVADNFRWEHFSNGADVVAYRLRKSEHQKPEWDGEGLPPVGCECMVRGEIGDDGWYECKVIAHTFFDGYNCAVFQTESTVSCSSEGNFRPIRSEADKKRDEIIGALKEGLGHAHGLYDLMQIYHLLNNGKIPHIRID